MATYERLDIPTLDLQGIYSGQEEGLQRLANDLLAATNKYGIVSTKNHGISMKDIQRFFDVGDEFFDLPDETKAKYERKLKPFQGYFQEHSRTIGEKSILMNETYGIINEEFGLPVEIPGFIEAAEVVFSQLITLSEKMLKVLDIALGGGDYLQRNHNGKSERVDRSTLLKLVRHPKVREDIPAGTIRLNEHYDFGTITFLHTMEGLQVQDAKGEWKTANIPEESILMQYGLALQRMSSDRLWAAKHRVVVTEEEKRANKPRRVLIFFHGPKLSTIVKPLDGSSLYPPIQYGDLFNQKAKDLYKY